MTEKIIVKGNTKLLKPAITQLMATYQLLENLDIEGSSFDDKGVVAGRRYNPQIKLTFREDSDFKPGTQQPKGRGQNRTRGRLTFRLMNETSETITKGELTRIGQKIKDIFGANNGYTWSKGKELYTYADWSKGYQLQILARSQTQAADLTQKILSIQNHTPIWQFLTKSENAEPMTAYPEQPITVTLLGEQVQLSKARPYATVRFCYAEARVHKLQPAIMLYDRTGKKAKALVK